MSFGAEPLPFATESRISQKTPGRVSEMIDRHPKRRFQAFEAILIAHSILLETPRSLLGMKPRQA
jgi:hypothetical protein